MKLGIGSYTFTWAVGIPGKLPPKRLSASALLDEAERLGVNLVQICDNLPFLDYQDREVDAFAEKARAMKIDVEWGTRGLNLEVIRRNVALCQCFESNVLRIVVDSTQTEHSMTQTLEQLKALLPECRAAGVKLAIENHDRTPAERLIEMIETLGPEDVGITLDTVNSFGIPETPEQVVAALAPYTMCLHVKDFTIQRPDHNLGFTVEGCAAGSGQLDVPWLLEALKVSPHPFNVILETWVTPLDSLAETIAHERRWADEGVAYLRTLIP